MEHNYTYEVKIFMNNDMVERGVFNSFDLLNTEIARFISSKMTRDIGDSVFKLVVLEAKTGVRLRMIEIRK